MRLNDRPADTKPHAGAVRFGSKERDDYLFRKLRRKPYAGITDRKENSIIVSSLRLDDDISFSHHVLHRLDAVDDQIHRNLLQLRPVAYDRREIVRQFQADRYVVSNSAVQLSDSDRWG